ncbi:Ubx5p [Sugiyamaella lignohabitans]|uniref:Ubx5p n=1 Tax=Sugiyamaella lignohabitans TaxID=796027 RepID=A0A167CP26_9ASCO|nr:Ubx5p [Sugiyamaella lignohabitans]ANB11941.1 Ubx5p [Sugiyamaella lignohabitans]
MDQDHSDEIAAFCAVTAADPESAQQYLAVADYDLDTAVTLFLEAGGPSIESQHRAASSTNVAGGAGGTGSGAASVHSPDPMDSGINNTNDEDEEAFVQRLQEEEYAQAGNGGGGTGGFGSGNDEVRERIRPVTERLVDPGFGAGFGGFGEADDFLGRMTRNLAMRGVTPRGIFNQGMPSQQIRRRQRGVFDNDEDEEDEDDDSDMEITGSNSFMEETVGSSNLTPHANRLAALFRPPFDLIQDVDLELAKNLGQEEKKWILVDIQNSREFSCQKLNRDLWSNKDVKATVKANFIFLQYSSEDSYGINYLQYYPYQGYPHIAILDPRTGERLRVWSEVPEPLQWIDDVHNFLSRYSLDPSHKNPIAKISRTKTDVQHMTEEEQIEFAVRQSLGVKSNSSSDDDFVSVHSDVMDEDSNDEIEVVEERSAVPESSGSSSRVPQAPDISESEPEDDHDLTEEDIFASILPREIQEPEADPKTTTRIQFRLADGSRIIRRFRLDDSVRTIFAFLKQNVEALSGHHFGLASDRRKLIDLVDETIQSAKLQNSVVLVEILD